MPAPRLAQLLGVGQSEPTTASSGRPARPMVAQTVSSGRGNLVRQAITLLVQHPEAARAVRDDGELDGVERPGVALLLEMLAVLREESLGTAQLLERFRGREEHPSLERLAASESLVPNANAAGRELRDLYARLVLELGPRQRLDALLTKAADLGLSAEEREELRRLQAQARPRPR